MYKQKQIIMTRKLKDNETTTPYNNIREVEDGDIVLCVPQNMVTEIIQRGYTENDKSIMININGHVLWLESDEFLEDFRRVNID